MCMQRQINALRYVRMAHGQKKEKEPRKVADVVNAAVAVV